MFTLRFSDGRFIECDKETLLKLEFFQKMFQNQMKESLSDEVFLEDELYEVINDFKDLSYEIPTNFLCEVIILADK